MGKRHVIIGSSAAGTRAAETIRRLSPDAEITVITDEANPLYSRCLLPHLLAGSLDEEGLAFRPQAFFSQLGIEPVLGEKVVGLDSENCRVTTDRNSVVGYDSLLVATGSSPAIPPIPGLEGEQVVGLRTLPDARKILALAEGACHALVLGAGFVGLEVAYALRRRGLEVTVAERLPHVLPGQMDEEASSIIADDIESEGVRLLLGCGIKGVEDSAGEEPRKERKRVTLENGETLEVDLLIVAAGVRSNVGFLKGSGVEIARGIPVDEYMATNVENIYAAGDVAETMDAATGTRGLTPIWPNAVVQGKVAGYNMAGKPKAYAAQIGLQNAVEFKDVPAIALGVTRPGESEGYEVLSISRPKRREYRKLVLDNGVPVGMILVGNIGQAGLVASLIRRARPMDETLIQEFLHGNLHYGYFLRSSPGQYASRI